MTGVESSDSTGSPVLLGARFRMGERVSAFSASGRFDGVGTVTEIRFSKTRPDRPSYRVLIDEPAGKGVQERGTYAEGGLRPARGRPVLDEGRSDVVARTSMTTKLDYVQHLEQERNWAKDNLKYVVLALSSRIDKAFDSFDRGDDDALVSVMTGILSLLRSFSADLGDDETYSNGRDVMTEVEVVRGIYTEHVWRPDPNAEESVQWEEDLTAPCSDGPDVVCEVVTDPKTQTLHTKVVQRPSASIAGIGAQ